MPKNFWKNLLLAISGLWILAAIYSVYAVTYGIVSLDWHRFLYGIIAIVVFTLIVIVVAIVAD